MTLKKADVTSVKAIKIKKEQHFSFIVGDRRMTHNATDIRKHEQRIAQENLHR